MTSFTVRKEELVENWILVWGYRVVPNYSIVKWITLKSLGNNKNENPC